MTKDKTWIYEAKPEEQGDFCDTNSRYEYKNGNITDAVEAEAEANEQGKEAVWIDASTDQNAAYNTQAGQKFNIYESETDGQGVSYQRRSK